MVGTSSWKQQFAEALSMEPIDQDNDEEQTEGVVKEQGLDILNTRSIINSSFKANESTLFYST